MGTQFSGSTGEPEGQNPGGFPVQPKNFQGPFSCSVFSVSGSTGNFPGGSG